MWHNPNVTTGTKENALKEGTIESKWSVLCCSCREGVGGHVNAVLLCLLQVFRCFLPSLD